MKLEAELHDSGPFVPGSWVRGRVRVLEGGASRSLSASLQYRERSPGYTHTAVEIPGGTLHTGDLQPGASFDFAIQMPPDALPGQALHHGETFWQVDVKSDERGTDTHAVVRVDESPQRAAPQPAGLPGPAPTDGTGAPLLAPGYSAAASGRDSKPRAGAVVGIIVGLAIFVYGIYQVVEAFKGEERTTYTVPIYQPQPPAGPSSDPGSSTSLFDCLDRAGTDTIARSRCISEYNNSVAPPGER